MKEKFLKRAGLLLCSAALLMSCSGRNNSGDKTSPTSETSQVSPDKDSGIDLLYPFDGGEANPLTEEFAKEATKDILNTPNVSLYLRQAFGDYLYDFILSHNHFSQDEFKTVMSLFSTLAKLTDGKDYQSEMGYKIWTLLANVNMDKLYALVREMKEDGKAYGYFYHVMTNSGDFGQGYAPSAIEADEYFEEKDERIHKLAQDYQSMIFKATGYTVWQYFDSIVNDILDDSGVYLLRAARILAQSMVTNLDSYELEYINFMTFINDGKYSDAVYARFEFVSQYVQENISGFANHLGNAFAAFDISASSWGALMPILKKLAWYDMVGSQVDINDFITKEQLADVNTCLDTVFITLNPKGIKALVKFLGLLGQGVTQYEINAFLGRADASIGKVPPYTAISDLYNAKYGELTSEEKTSFKQAMAAFGISLDVVFDELDQAMAEGSLETVSSIMERVIGEQLNKRFGEVMNSDFYTNDGEALIFREGEEIKDKDVIKYLQSSSSPLIKEDGREYGREYSADYRSDFKLPETIDTSKIGQYQLHVQFETKFGNKGEGNSYTFDGYVFYQVVPGDVEYIYEDIEQDIKIGRDGRYGDHVYTDNSGNAFIESYNNLVLQKGASYDEGYASLTSSYIDGAYIYDSDAKRFMGIESNSSSSGKNGLYFDELSVDIASFDTSEAGRHYLSAERKIQEYKDNELVAEIGTFPVYFVYEVSEYFPSSADRGAGIESEIK